MKQLEGVWLNMQPHMRRCFHSPTVGYITSPPSIDGSDQTLDQLLHPPYSCFYYHSNPLSYPEIWTSAVQQQSARSNAAVEFPPVDNSEESGIKKTLNTWGSDPFCIMSAGVRPLTRVLQAEADPCSVSPAVASPHSFLTFPNGATPSNSSLWSEGWSAEELSLNPENES